MRFFEETPGPQFLTASAICLVAAVIVTVWTHSHAVQRWAQLQTLSLRTECAHDEHEKSYLLLQRAELEMSPDEVMHDLDAAIAIDPGNGIAHAQRAAVYFSAQSWEKALVDLDAFVAFDRAETKRLGQPTGRYAEYLMRADCLEQLGRRTDALTAYEDVLKNGGHDDVLYHAAIEAAVLQQSLGDKEGAMRMLQKAANLQKSRFGIASPPTDAVSKRQAP